jgi:uncharacterized protein (DUF934 family)
MRPPSPAGPRRVAPATLVGPAAPIVGDAWIDFAEAGRNSCGDAGGDAGADSGADEAQRLLPVGDIIVGPGRLADVPADWPGRLGLRLASDARVEAVLAHLPRLKLIAVEFPTFRDGRGYSLARLLRQRHGFAGDIRAVGDVLRDQLDLMWRCGFTSALLRDSDPLAALGDARGLYRLAYQTAADATSPIWTLRLAAAKRV